MKGLTAIQKKKTEEKEEEEEEEERKMCSIPPPPGGHQGSDDFGLLCSNYEGAWLVQVAPLLEVIGASLCSTPPLGYGPPPHGPWTV